MVRVEDNSGRYFLHVNVSFENNIEISWEIDEYTAENLKIITEFDDKYKMVLWNNDPEDWRTHDTYKILNHIKNSNVSGSIVILHETQAVLDALPRMIEYFQELGLQIVSL